MLSQKVLLTILATALLSIGSYYQPSIANQSFLGSPDIILPAIKNGESEVAVIMIGGAQIASSQYQPLAQEIQNGSDLSLWIGIPGFLVDTPNPVEFSQGVDRVLAAMKSKGMKTDKVVITAHSLGGIMTGLYLEKNPVNAIGAIFMGSFLERKRFELTEEGLHKLNFNTPVLTIAGELDGLARIVRMAEAHYKQNVQAAVKSELFPVVVLEGVSHMQFASGDAPGNVQKNDLMPEISEKEAHSQIAEVVSQYIEFLINGKKSSSLQNKINQSNEFFEPIIESLELEGFYNFKPACNGHELINEPNNKCTHGSKWAENGQRILAGIDADHMHVDDNSHRVYSIAPVHLPIIWNTCDGKSDCKLNATTVSEALYENLDSLDTGFWQQSATEIRCKLTSKQQSQKHNGVASPDFDQLDGGKQHCAQINQAAWNWALSKVPKNALQRFKKYGINMEFGEDDGPWNAGPLWIWKYMQYNMTVNANNEKVLKVISPFMATPIDYKIQAAAGFHYCKLMSPAKAMEWILIDGLRENKSL